MMERSRSRLNSLQALRVADRETDRLVETLRNKDRSIDWIIIGTANAPNFQNGWDNVGLGNVLAAFKRHSSGLVEVRGLVKLGVVPSIVFTLPEGFRTDGLRRYAVDTNTGHGAVEVNPNGYIYAASGGNGYFSINLLFSAEQ